MAMFMETMMTNHLDFVMRRDIYEYLLIHVTVLQWLVGNNKVNESPSAYVPFTASSMSNR